MARAANTRDQEEGEKAPRGSSSSSGISGARAAAMARQQIEEMINRPCESVSGLSRKPDGWSITLEVVELERVPPTTDILATYRVQLDPDGELMGYERVSRYYRNQAGEGS